MVTDRASLLTYLANTLSLGGFGGGNKYYCHRYFETH